MRFEYVIGNVTYYCDSKTKDDDYLWEEGKGLDKDIRFEFGYTQVTDTTIAPDVKHDVNCGSFSFAPMPGCCGVVVSHHTWLDQKWRGGPKSHAFKTIKQEFARRLGYGAIIATTVMTDVVAVKSMLKSNYRISATFTNPRTKNALGVGVRVL